MSKKEDIERLFEEIIKEILNECDKEEKIQKKNLKEATALPFDMALNYLLSEYRKGNLKAKICRKSMPEGDYISVIDSSPNWTPFLYYYTNRTCRKRPYSPNDNSIFALDWILKE